MGRGYSKGFHVSINCCLCSQCLLTCSFLFVVVRAQIQASQKPVPQASLRKITSPREGERWRLPSNYMVLWQGRGMMREYLRFSNWLQCDWFCMHLRCGCFSAGFWISHKWNWPTYCCWIVCSCGEGGSRAFYPAIFLKSSPLSVISSVSPGTWFNTHT